MSKSDKITVAQRVQDVGKLILAGAELSDIRAYANERGWNVSFRQLQRYVRRAYQQFAKASLRNQKQLLGRHLLQRRGLYARALKGGELKTALHVLKDEAALQGIYPAKNGSHQADSNISKGNSGQDCVLDRRQRLIRWLQAESKQDKVELALLDQVIPGRLYRLRDIQIPILMLHLLSLVYVNEQLELAMTYLHCAYCATLEELGVPQEEAEEPDDVSWDLIGKVHAYRFQVGREGWQLFMQGLGVAEKRFVEENYHGCMLETAEEALGAVAPTAEDVRMMAAAANWPLKDLVTGDHLARGWRRQLAQVLRS